MGDENAAVDQSKLRQSPSYVAAGFIAVLNQVEAHDFDLRVPIEINETVWKHGQGKPRPGVGPKDLAFPGCSRGPQLGKSAAAIGADLRWTVDRKDGRQRFACDAFPAAGLSGRDNEDREESAGRRQSAVAPVNRRGQA